MPVLKPKPVSPRAAVRRPGAIDGALDAALFKSLSDPTRILVLSCLIKCGRPCSVSEVAACCSVEFSVVNKHMKILARAGVLEAKKQGRTVWYAARCGDLCRRFSVLIDAISEWCPNLPSPGSSQISYVCCASVNHRRGR